MILPCRSTVASSSALSLAAPDPSLRSGCGRPLRSSVRTTVAASSALSLRSSLRTTHAFQLGRLALIVVVSAGCGSVSPPFNEMKGAQMTVYRLQNFEPPQQAQATAPATAGLQIPPQIQQWIAAGASLLPPGLLPPGLLPGASPAPPAAADAPRFHGFRILEWQQVSDSGVKNDVVDVFGHGSNFTNPQLTCMYAELGFAIAQTNNPTPADILVSLSCQSVQPFNFAWPYQQTGITPDTEKKFAQIAQRVFAGR